MPSVHPALSRADGSLCPIFSYWKTTPNLVINPDCCRPPELVKDGVPYLGPILCSSKQVSFTFSLQINIDFLFGNTVSCFNGMPKITFI